MLSKALILGLYPLQDLRDADSERQQLQEQVSQLHAEHHAETSKLQMQVEELQVYQNLYSLEPTLCYHLLLAGQPFSAVHVLCMEPIMSCWASSCPCLTDISIH